MTEVDGDPYENNPKVDNYHYGNELMKVSGMSISHDKKISKRLLTTEASPTPRMR
jgi:hypothetical protein